MANGTERFKVDLLLARVSGIKLEFLVAKVRKMSDFQKDEFCVGEHGSLGT